GFDGLTALRMHADFSGTFPTERVIDDDRNTVACGVDALVHRLQGVAADLVCGPSHDVVVPLRVFINDADAGAGGEVVELVEEDLLPILGEFAGGILVAVQPS